MTRWALGVVGMAVILPLGVARADDPVRIDERFPVGHRYQVQMRVELTGVLTPPAEKGKIAKPVKVEGISNIEYSERVLAVDGGGRVSKSLRNYDKMEFRRTLAGQPQELTLRPEVRRQVLLRKGNTEVPFSPEGPLTWGEIDAVRTDVFIPALTGLFPTKPVQVGDRWTADTMAVQELTDLEKINNGTLECRLERVESGGRRARVTFNGIIRGVGEDGPVRHRLQGTYHFDLVDGYLADLTLLGTTSMLDKDDKEAGRVDGQLVLQRQLGSRAAGLSDTAIKGLKTEPDADNTMMLYDNPSLGVRFSHPRRWKVAQVMGAQVALDTVEGNSILITVDPLERVPTPGAFLNETRTWLVKQKAKLIRTYSPKHLRDGPSLDAFALEAEMGGQKLWLDYYVTSQANGGVTVAGRLLPGELAEMRREVDRVARSVEVTRRISAAAP
ncbi:MAG: hypothetical protein U0736_26740, partial [Gemmataceae bacterium]